MNWWEMVSLALGIALGLGAVVALSSRGISPESEATSRPLRPPRLRAAALAAALHRAGLGAVRPGVAVGVWVVVSLVIAAMVGVFIPIPILAPLAALAVLFAGRSYLRSQIDTRERRLRAAWPGLVDHIRSAIRSGASVAEAVVLLVDRVPEELRPAFVRYRESVSRGGRVDSALAQLKEAVANPVADRIIEALRMSHEVGGRELPSVMQALQVSLRADIGVREDAVAKQAWIRAASRLGVAAPWLVLILLSGRPETVAAYSSLEGAAIVIGGAALSVLAFLMMSRLGALPREQRWFAGGGTP